MARTTRRRAAKPRALRPRTKVPATLVHDLKRYAWEARHTLMAYQLLAFDGTTTGLRSPLGHAELLAAVSHGLAGREVETLASARNVGGASPAGSGLGAAVVALHTIRRLQRRIWRVINGLRLGAAERGAP